MELSRLNSGAKIKTPINTTPPKTICMGFIFDLKNKGSSSAVMIGNVYKDSIPNATFDNFKA